jgi:hypothetical protein
MLGLKAAYFNVVAVYLVVTDLECLDAAAFTLALFQLNQKIIGVLAQ